MKVRRIPSTTLQAVATLLTPYVTDLTPVVLVKALKAYSGDPPSSPAPAPGQLLTVSEAARRLAAHRTIIVRMIQKGDIQSVKVSARGTRIPETEIVRMGQPHG